MEPTIATNSATATGTGEVCSMDSPACQAVFIAQRRLVWWFRSSLHYIGESFKRTSETKPHYNHRLLVSFRIRSSLRRVRRNVANFGFGTLACQRAPTPEAQRRQGAATLELQAGVPVGKAAVRRRANKGEMT